MTVVRDIPVQVFCFIVSRKRVPHGLIIRRHGYVSDYGAAVDPSNNYCTTTGLVRQVKEHLATEGLGVFVGHHPSLLYFGDGFFSAAVADRLDKQKEVPDKLGHTDTLMTEFAHETSSVFKAPELLGNVQILFDILFEDQPKGVLSLREWDSGTLFERFSRIDSSSQATLGRGLLNALRKCPEHLTIEGYRAAHYLSSVLTEDDTSFSDAIMTEARERTERHNELVSRGYPDMWAYKTMRCRDDSDAVPVPHRLP